jgi:hypothetical protein
MPHIDTAVHDKKKEETIALWDKMLDNVGISLT